jgi:hypothetical protein
MIDLHTTNLLLGIIAAMSVLGGIALIGLAVGGWIVYKKVLELGQLVSDLESRQLEPLRRKFDSILADVKMVTARVSEQTERVDHAITGTMDRVDETAARVRSSVREKVASAVGVVHGIRAILMSILHSEPRHDSEARAAGRAY